MADSIDKLIEDVERKKKLLDDVLERAKALRETLSALPPELVAQTSSIFSSESLSAQKNKSLFVRENPSVSDVATAVVTRLCTGKSAAQCARLILECHAGGPMHYIAVAKEALERGYRGRTTGTPEEIEIVTIKSFWAAMSRSEELESVGKGQYQLRNSHSVIDERPGRTRMPSRRDQLREFLIRRGPLSMTEIVEQSGIPRGTVSTYLYNGDFVQDENDNWLVRPST